MVGVETGTLGVLKVLLSFLPSSLWWFFDRELDLLRLPSSLFVVIFMIDRSFKDVDLDNLRSLG